MASSLATSPGVTTISSRQTKRPIPFTSIGRPSCSTHVANSLGRSQPSVSDVPASSGAHQTIRGSRREMLMLLLVGQLVAPAAMATAAMDIDELEAMAFESYANRDFQGAVNALSQIVQVDASNPRWFEMRAQVLVDGKAFQAALDDFRTALELTPQGNLTDRARVVAGRALAEEGLSDWRAALNDYTQAMNLATEGGESVDPYVLNSRGNCYNSLGMWAEAREDYLTSSQLFQQAKGFRGRGGSTTARLDGAIFAASNAALMLAQMGDEHGAIKEMERIARRAPGSVDMRAALASLYYHQGKAEQAESMWEFACDKIEVGCTKYQWVSQCPLRIFGTRVTADTGINMRMWQT